MIEIRHLRKEYETVTPLEDVSTVINKGEVVSIIGPSGTGKSTFIRCINRLETPTSGEILIDGENILSENVNVDKLRLKLGMVFQSFNLYDHLTVIENIMLAPIKLLKKSRQEAYDYGMKMLHLVGMQAKALEYPDSLSGGQKQRAAIARTLAMDPEVILLDEPTSALDPGTTREIINVIKTLADKGRTMLIVTHSMELAKRVSSRVLYMDEGGIYEEGTVEKIFKNPEKPKTREFIVGMDGLEIMYAHADNDYNVDMTRIQSYALEMGFDVKKTYHMELVFEEVLYKYVYPLLKEQDYCRSRFEYDRLEDKMKLVIKYTLSDIGDEDITMRDYSFTRAFITEFKMTDSDERDGYYYISIVIWNKNTYDTITGRRIPVAPHVVYDSVFADEAAEDIDGSEKTSDETRLTEAED